jgi:hypothetical protein
LAVKIAMAIKFEAAGKVAHIKQGHIAVSFIGAK